MNWEQTVNIQNFTNQMNVRFPNRDRTSDGSIGDKLHQGETSGHNPDDTPGSKPAWDGDPDNIPEVRAKDIDSDLREPGTSMQDVVDHLTKLPDLEKVCRYLIYNRKMYHSRDKFRPTAYTGSSPHTEHLHYEGAWTQEADRNGSFNFRLDEVNMPTADEIIDRMVTRLRTDGDPFQIAMRAIVWQYSGGGLQGATTTLDALSDSQLIQKSLDRVTSLLLAGPSVDVAALAAALAPLINVKGGASPDEVEARLRKVFGAAAAG